MATRDACALLACPRCGTIVEISGEISAVLALDTRWLYLVVGALCACWARDLPSVPALHMWVRLVA